MHCTNQYICSNKRSHHVDTVFTSSHYCNLLMKSVLLTWFLFAFIWQSSITQTSDCCFFFWRTLQFPRCKLTNDNYAFSVLLYFLLSVFFQRRLHRWVSKRPPALVWVGKGGRAGNSTDNTQPLSPGSVWLGPGAPLPSVFSLHGFVCELSEIFQESVSFRGRMAKTSAKLASLFDVFLRSCYLLFSVVMHLITHNCN